MTTMSEQRPEARKRLYILRHGLTAWNEEKRIVGHNDLELSPRGRRQAERARELLAPCEIERALTSPLTRTRQTGEIVLGEREIELRQEPRLIELALAGWEGRRRSELRDDERWQRWITTPHLTTTPEGEHLEDVERRAVAALREGLEALSDGGGLAIFTHGGVARVLILHLLGLPLSAYHMLRCDCASISAFELEPTGEMSRVLGINLPGSLS
jgi:phosphoserine phosphatase